MRRRGLALCLLASGIVAAWAQQPEISNPAPPSSSTVVRDAHSTKDDLAVPLCPAQFNDSLDTDGIAGKGDRGTRPPRPENTVVAEFSPEARKAARKLHIDHFEDMLSLLVGADGIPRETCLKTSAGYGLDARAAKSVMQYRFDPATNEGKPVSVRIAVQVNFRLY
jgi:hypothetical protein